MTYKGSLLLCFLLVLVSFSLIQGENSSEQGECTILSRRRPLDRATGQPFQSLVLEEKNAISARMPTQKLPHHCAL